MRLVFVCNDSLVQSFPWSQFSSSARRMRSSRSRPKISPMLPSLGEQCAFGMLISTTIRKTWCVLSFSALSCERSFGVMFYFVCDEFRCRVRGIPSALLVMSLTDVQLYAHLLHTSCSLKYTTTLFFVFCPQKTKCVSLPVPQLVPISILTLRCKFVQSRLQFIIIHF